MSDELDKLKRSIGSYKEMVKAARAESKAAAVTPQTPRAEQTGSPSPTAGQPPNESTAPSV